MSLDDDTAFEILQGRDADVIFYDGRQEYIRFHDGTSVVRVSTGKQIPTSRMRYINFSRFLTFHNSHKNGDGKHVDWTPEAIKEFEELFLHTETSGVGGIVLFEHYSEKTKKTTRGYSGRIIESSR